MARKIDNKETLEKEMLRRIEGKLKTGAQIHWRNGFEPEEILNGELVHVDITVGKEKWTGRVQLVSAYKLIMILNYMEVTAGKKITKEIWLY